MRKIFKSFLTKRLIAVILFYIPINNINVQASNFLYERDENYKKAESLVEQEKYEEALNYYDKLIDVWSDYHTLHISRCRVYEKMQNYKRAIKCYNKIIKIFPKQHSVYIFQGVALGIDDQNLEALKALNKSIKLEDYYLAHFYKGKILAKLDRYKDSIIEFDKTISLDPDNYEAYFEKATVLNYLQRYNESLEALDKSILLNPDNNFSYLVKGYVYQNLNNYDKATQMFDKVISMNRSLSYLACDAKGYNFIKTKNYATALEMFNKAIEINPNEHKAYISKSMLCAMLNDKDGAIENIDNAIRIQPEDKSLINIKNNLLKN